MSEYTGWEQLHQLAQQANEREITRLVHLAKLERERGDLYQQRANDLEEQVKALTEEAEKQKRLKEYNRTQRSRWEDVATALFNAINAGTVVFNNHDDQHKFLDAKNHYRKQNGDDPIEDTPA